MTKIHEFLTDEQDIIFQWQYRILGDFEDSIMEAVCRADDGNLRKLSLSFPSHVFGYISFSREDGWWETVQKLVEEHKLQKEAINDEPE